MSRAKITIAALFATLVFSAVVAGPASANWFIGGTELGVGKTAALANTAQVDTAAVLNIPKLKVKLTCTGNILRGVNPEIIGTNKGKAKSLIFEGCKTVEPATGCELLENPQEIPTEPIEATVTKATSPADRVFFKPKTKTLFANINFKEKNVCALEGKEPITGGVTINAPTGQTEILNQPIEGLGSFENNSLEIGGAKAYIEGGRALLLVLTAQTWSFH